MNGRTERFPQARLSRALHHLICSQCQQPLSLLRVGRPLIDLFPGAMGMDATVSFTTDWRFDREGVWCLSPAAARRYQLSGRADKPLKSSPREFNTQDLFRRWSYRLRTLTGQDAVEAAQRGSPRLPALVRCPRCNQVSQIDDELLQMAAARAENWYLSRPIRETTVNGSLGFFQSSQMPTTREEVPHRRGKGHRRGGRGRNAPPDKGDS